VAREDARVTSAGRWLRCGLDELPQLWNVLKGDMSVVGPRPDEPHALQLYSSDEKAKLRIRPGITGLAQISGRNELPWKERLRYDIEYVEKQSFLLDIRIILLTVAEIFKGRTASVAMQ
jgi:lipopolysaccharide/colanic/teichoic acid biosynthesis glycosyltransferase